MENKKTVYFDKNVFSKLRIKDCEKIDKIIKSKNKFIYLYSIAHIFDLQNDNSNIKYKDMEFMTYITDNNYIYFDTIKKDYIIIKNDVKDCFNETINFNSIPDKLDCTNIKNSLLSILMDANITPQPELNCILDLYQQFLNLKINIKEYTKNYTEEEKALCYPAIINNDYLTLGELINIFINEFKNKIEDEKIYKKERKNIKEFYNKLDNKEEIFQKVNTSIKELQLDSYAKNVGEYILLDIFNNNLSEKKVKYRNLNIDGQHGIFIDKVNYFVTDDNGLINKLKTLHKQKLILKLDEFINII